MKNGDTPLLKSTLAICSAILLWAAWPAGGIAPLLFVALVPMLLLEDIVFHQQKQGLKSRLFPYAYLGFMCFNFATTWWIWYASAFGMFGAVLTNALLMTTVFQLFHLSRIRFGNAIGYTSLIVFWMGFEYFHMDWDLTWPWLNLGNGFAAWANMVQWYEFTGTQGGTLWIWLSNLLLFRIITAPSPKRKTQLTTLGIVIFFPLMFSFFLLKRYQEKPHPAEVVVVQPNIDPYNEKFNGSNDEQLDKMLRLANSAVTPKTRLVVLPETALPTGIWSEDIENHRLILRLKAFSMEHPGLRILTGLSYYRFFHEGEKLSPTARSFKQGPGHYDAYNAAMQIQGNNAFQYHFKSRLVPGVEKMPFPILFGYLENFAIDLGGITGSLGVQEHPSVFTGDSITAAPVICYESIYGEYVGEYIRKGANLICIMTNDGWWSDTPGYRQHCQYARLRAIEHRRSVARSANTGISCFIDQTGKISQATSWWVPAVIKSEVNINNDLTFYSTHGDLLGRTAYYISGFLLAITLLGGFFQRRK